MRWRSAPSCCEQQGRRRHGVSTASCRHFEQLWVAAVHGHRWCITSANGPLDRQLSHTAGPPPERRLQLHAVLNCLAQRVNGLGHLRQQGWRWNNWAKQQRRTASRQRRCTPSGRARTAGRLWSSVPAYQAAAAAAAQQRRTSPTVTSGRRPSASSAISSELEV